MISLTLACTSSDRTRPLMDGRFRVPGCDITFLPGEPEDIFRRALRDRAFDISELSMGSHIVTTARGDSPYVGVPVFLSRAFRHSAVYIRTDRGIRSAADLAGRTIGLPEYQQTAALWVRGFLREQYGVDTKGIAWRTGGERVAITLPAGFDVKPLGRDLEAALAAGEIDALIGPRPPRCFLDGSAPSRGSGPIRGRRRKPGSARPASSPSCTASPSGRTWRSGIPGCRSNCSAPSPRRRRPLSRSCAW